MVTAPRNLRPRRGQLLRAAFLAAGLAAIGSAAANAADTVPAPAASATVTVPDAIPGGRIWIDVETHGRAPFVQEMVLVRVRGTFTIPIALYKIEEPDFAGFRAMTVGRDTWYETSEDGKQARGFRRTVALFPQRSGTLTIGPFVQHLTIIDTSGARATVDIATPPTALEVAPAPVAEGAWWLPAQSLTLSETWSNDPEKLAIGQSTRRTVVIEAAGVTDDQIPPLPAIRVPDLIAFPGAPERRTVLGVGEAPAERREQTRQLMPKPGRLAAVFGSEGPQARVAYSWDIRPTTDAPAILPAIEVPWFDTVSNTPRVAILPARTVAVGNLGRSVEEMEHDLGIAADAGGSRGGAFADLALAGMAFLAAFAVTAVGLGHDWLVPGGAFARLRAWLAARRILAAMAAAARRGDVAAVWRGARGLAALDAAARPSGPADWRDDPAARAAVDRLEACLFAGEGDPVAVARSAVSAIAKARRGDRGRRL